MSDVELEGKPKKVKIVVYMDDKHKVYMTVKGHPTYVVDNYRVSAGLLAALGFSTHIVFDDRYGNQNKFRNQHKDRKARFISLVRDAKARFGFNNETLYIHKDLVDKWESRGVYTKSWETFRNFCIEVLGYSIEVM